MVDIVAPEVRSRIMAGIRGRDTTPELAIRRGLHARGLRFRLHVRYLPGRPDIVLPRFRTVIFVHGCFWHRHPGCPKATTPSTRPDFWAAKFIRNVERDREQSEALIAAGWRVGTIWGCAIGPRTMDRLLDEVTAFVRAGVGDRQSEWPRAELHKQTETLSGP